MKNYLSVYPIKTNIRSVIKKYSPTLLLFLVFVGGIVFGAINSGSADKQLCSRLDFLLRTNYDIKTTYAFFYPFISSLASLSIFIFAELLLGTSPWGGVLCIALPFFRGYGYGLAGGFLYSSFGAYGFFYNVLIILPGVLFGAMIIISATKESIKNSFSVMFLFRKNSVDDDRYIKMKNYLRAMLIYLALSAVCAIVDSLMSFCFSWIFRF